ncbi:MAG: hypothetical protein RIC89_02510, partial [Pseudomonadales bacterium]
MKRIPAFIAAFVAALLITYLFGTLTYSQLIMGNLVEMGMPVDAGVRAAASVLPFPGDHRQAGHRMHIG